MPRAARKPRTGFRRRLNAHVLARLTRRKRALDSVVVGLLLTLFVIAIDSAGWLWRLEFAMYDARASAFQFFLPKPTDKLVHLDIDENALQAVDASEKTSWPWKRTLLADMFDEIALAKPKVVGLDIMFSEHQKPTLEPMDGVTTTQPAQGATYAGPAKWVMYDEALGDSLKRLGCALVPVAMPFERRATPTDLQIAMRAELSRDLTLSPDQLADRLRSRGVASSNLADQISREFLDAWHFEMYAAIQRELNTAPQLSRVDCKRRLMTSGRLDSVLDRAFDELYDDARSSSRMLGFGLAIPPQMPPLFPAELQNVPVPPIAQAAAYSGNVAFPFLADGRVRAVPLFVRHGDRMFPQMGLAMACAQLNVSLDDLRFSDNAVVIPTKDGREIKVPYHPYRSTALGETIPTFMDIPFWGGEAWETMYDHPAHATPANHLSMVALLDLVLTKRKIATNAKAADDALIAVMSVVDQPAAETYASRPQAARKAASRLSAFERVKASSKDMRDLLHGLKPNELDEPSKRFLASYDALPKAMTELTELQHRLDSGRAELARNLGGKAALVGWTATGAAADFVPTSVHDKCPGVVLHGAIFNAVITGELWRKLPDWTTYLGTAVLGVLMTLAVATMAPSRALLVALGLMIGYALLNGLVLFDYGNLILGAAGPLLCVALVWQLCTLIRFIVERYNRSKIEGRFRSYVDPVLVDCVVEDPDQVKFEGQVREMTVCFTDLGNFTPLTAKLKEQTVPLLNRIFDAVVPEIRKHNGYVNKFLGDGVMFFFGAPRQNPRHALDAVNSVLDIQIAMRRINAELTERGLPNVTLRAGVNTGNMVVGDAGSEKASDYTVLGDDVNLASRMESANKQLGTMMLVSARTVELAGEEHGVLLRPVGQIRVVGRDEPVEAFEVMCRESEATPGQRRLADLTREMVGAYADAKFEQCLELARQIDAEFGESKLTKLYRERCEHFSETAPEASFDCTLTLAEK
jgi:class 3 adenylate cyclase